MRLSIVIPTYNEKDNILTLVKQLDENLQGVDYEIIFVDDSTDETPEVIKRVQENSERIRMFHRDTEKGLATAVLLGFNEAEGEYLAVMDADLQHPPAILRKMYAVMEEGADFCIPSRFIFNGSDGGLNLYRKFVSATARYLGKFMLKSIRNVSDPTSGLFMFRKEAIKGADLRPIGWKIMVEVLAMADFETIYEIPYCFEQRNAGESKLNTSVTIEYIKQLLRLRRIERKKKIKVVRLNEEQVEKVMEKCYEQC